VTFYRIMAECREHYPVAAMAAVYGVSTSGFYEWLGREPSARERRHDELAERVREAFDASSGIYGSRKLTRELVERKIGVCRNTVAELMRDLGLRSRAQRRRHITTTDSAHLQPVAPNTLGRDFAAAAPNQKWVADITYIETAEGFVYLAAVMDLFSRRIVGWSLSDSLESTLVLEALENAIRLRTPEPGLVHHSDRGVQYASERHRGVLAEHGIECSMSRRGDCWDNAPMERFMNSLKNEWVYHDTYATIEDARTGVFRYIEIFYNRERRHQALGYVSPCRYEDLHMPSHAA
jgi:transposase InsO family protein